jgi:serine protease
MKRLFLKFVCLGIILAFLLGELFTPSIGATQTTPTLLTQTPATATAGEFDSIVLDFQETPSVLGTLSDTLASFTRFNLKPTLNSAFSEADHVYIVRGNQSTLQTLQSSELAAQTEFIEPNYIYSQSGGVVNDPDYDKQWNFRQINLEGAWKRGATGKGVTVAVIDTGISKGPDLAKTEFVPGYDFVNDRENANDDNGHGTHVAGTVAQSTNNGYGVAGVAYGAKLMPLKVLSRGGSGTVADIAEAIRFAADKGAQVINMSLGGGGDSKLMREAIDYAHKKGVVVIAAAGNESSSQASYPAFYPHVIAVSATGPDRQKANYSNYGEGVDIAAPGGASSRNPLEGILQETINPRSITEFLFRPLQGTSMAAPHVAGVAALVKSRNRGLSPDKVGEILQKSAQPVKDDSRNYFGAGILDADKAVKMSGGGWNWFGGGWGISYDWSAVQVPGLVLKLALAAVITWFLVPRRSTFNPWRFSFLLGLFSGSVGLFVFKGLSIGFVPTWIFRFLGSAIPEMGDVFSQDALLNPVFAGLWIPFGLMMLLISHPGLKWWTLGIAIGMTSFMTVAAFTTPSMWLLGQGLGPQIYLGMNAAICFMVTALFMRVATDDDRDRG